METSIEGRQPVYEALKSGHGIKKIFVMDSAKGQVIDDIVRLAAIKGIPFEKVKKSKLDGLAEGRNHQGVIAIAAAYRYYEVEEILERAKKMGEDPLLVILDEIQDPHNLGSILRTSDGAGVHGVIIPKRRSAALTPVVAKTSAGAIEYIPVARVTNISKTIEELKEQGIWIFGADAQGNEEYYNANLKGPIALVIGSEGKGIGRLVKEKCDFLVKLPMKGKVSSLNAAVACGIILFEIRRQRGKD